MSKKTVIRADLIGKKCMSEILSTVAKLEGIKSMDIDPDKCTLTVVGGVDPVRVVRELRKARFVASIVSVEDDKPKEKKDPCQEACEKACKEACKDACDNNGWPPRCCVPGCRYGPCALPNCYFYGARASVGYVCYDAYEERSPGGECAIQ